MFRFTFAFTFDSTCNITQTLGVIHAYRTIITTTFCVCVCMYLYMRKDPYKLLIFGCFVLCAFIIFPFYLFLILAYYFYPTILIYLNCFIFFFFLIINMNNLFHHCYLNLFFIDEFFIFYILVFFFAFCLCLFANTMHIEVVIFEIHNPLEFISILKNLGL